MNYYIMCTPESSMFSQGLKTSDKTPGHILKKIEIVQALLNFPCKDVHLVIVLDYIRYEQITNY